MKRILLFLLPGLLCLSGTLFAQDDNKEALESITETELRDHIFFLASDYMKGRFSPSTEYDIAAHYVASQFASAGVQPMKSNKECMDGFFQNVPFEKVVIDDDVKWILNTKEGEQEFVHNDDFKVLVSGLMPEDPLDVVFLGYGIHEPDLGWDDLDGMDIEGKMVILMTGAPQRNGEEVFPDSISQKYKGMQGLQGRVMNLFDKNPAAMIVVLDSASRAMAPYNFIPSGLKTENYHYMGHEDEEGGMRFPMVYLVKDRVLEAIFAGQKSSPALIAEKGLDKYQSLKLKKVKLTTSFPVKEKTRIDIKNVVAIVQGTDSVLSKEYITVGAHLDHVLLPMGMIANGADDNASGSAGVLEIAEAVAMNPPKRSVVFITYTAEEMGLYGSDYFVNGGPLKPEEIKFNVNLDMIGRTKKENMETRAHYVLGPEKFEKGLVPFITDINENSINWPLILDFHHPYSGSSDHSNYAKHDIPCFFFFSGDHEDLHQPGDDPEKIEYDKAAAISKLAYLITMELGNMDEVPTFME